MISLSIDLIKLIIDSTLSIVRLHLVEYPLLLCISITLILLVVITSLIQLNRSDHNEYPKKLKNLDFR